jgi:hypothetical protein
MGDPHKRVDDRDDESKRPVIVMGFLCEACAEGLGLERDAPLTEARCRECSKVKLCVTTWQPAQAAEPSPPPS